MKVVEDQSTLSSWVTIICLLALGAVGYLGYQNRERFFPSTKPKVVATTQLDEETERKFYEARDHIVAGRYDEASALLTRIDTDKVPQPTRNWMTMQNGLSYLLAGKLPEARAEFAKVEQRGPFTKDPRQEKLANFFLLTARLAASEEPAKSEVEREFQADSVEAFGLLVLGVKDWLLGHFEDSATLLHAFKTTEPPGPEIWLRRYQRIGDAYAEAFAAYTLATEAATAAGSHEQKEAAIKSIAQARSKLKNQPGLVAKLTGIEQELTKQVEAVNAEMAMASAASDAADKVILDEIKSRVAQFNEKYNFGDAFQIVFTTTAPASPKGKTAYDGWYKRTEWLAKFKSVLIADLNAGGYAKPVAKKDGTKVAGITGADDYDLKAGTKAVAQWPELAADSLVEMATEFQGKAKDADAVDRKWLLGNFLYELGRRPDGLAMMRDAAAAKADYKAGLPLFPEDGVK